MSGLSTQSDAAFTYLYLLTAVNYQNMEKLFEILPDIRYAAVTVQKRSTPRDYRVKHNLNQPTHKTVCSVASIYVT